MKRMQEIWQMFSLKKSDDPATPLMIPVSKFDVLILVAVVVSMAAYYCWTHLLN